ncbi:MAG: hypothetical protein AAFR30_03395, partial [Cyanobacteria bacterium J06628_4]
FAAPPQATTLILNPARYLAGERAIDPVEVPLNVDETLASQTIRGEYAVRLLLARQPETRPLVNSIGNGYITDTLGVITNTDGDIIHRWVITLNSSNNIESLATGLTTALAAELEKQPAVETNNGSITFEW